MPALLAFALVRRTIKSQRFQEGARAAFGRAPSGDVNEDEGIAAGDGAGPSLRGRLLRAVLVFAALSVAARIVAAVASSKLTLGDASSDEFRTASIMAGREFHSRAEHLKSGTAVTILGGMALDLTKATLDPGGASLELDTRMGGIEVRVPAHWSVKVEQDTRGGGLEVDVASPGDLPEDAPKLRIHAVTRMGGGQVHAKAT